MKYQITQYLSRSPFSTLCLMALCFLSFGFFSFKLFFLFESNIGLIKNFGVLALMEGAAKQLLMILFNTFMSVISYTLWKACEKLLIDWLFAKKTKP